MPATPPENIYDVFISYSDTDAAWVWGWLVPRLKNAGVGVCTDRESFELGVPALINMENAVSTSRHTLLVLTPAYLASDWAMYEQILTQTQDPRSLRQRTIPVLRQSCDLPKRIAMLTYADLTGKRDDEAELAKIVRAICGISQPSQASQPKIQPPSSPAPTQPTVNTAALRELLLTAFSDEELTTFCFDFFQSVYENFAGGITRSQKVQALMEHCSRHGEMTTLLDRVREANTYQYRRYEARLQYTQSRPSQPPLSPLLPPNPFGNTLAIRDGNRFIGREAELHRLQVMLVHGSVALQGEAKIGKSSLLWRLKNIWRGTVLGPLDCQELESRHDFYTDLAELLGLDETGWPTIRRALKAQTSLLLLDELDVGPSIGLTYDDLARFRGVCNNHDGLKVVTVSRKQLKHIFPDPGHGSEAYNFLVPLTLSPMTEAESLRLLAHPWAPEAPQFMTAVLHELFTLTEGHPCKLHRAAFHRYESLTNSTYNWLARYQEDLENLL